MLAKMMHSGFFVHEQLDVDKPIYHCIKQNYLEDLFCRRALYLRRVIEWEDTWENPSRYLQAPQDNPEKQNELLNLDSRICHGVDDNNLFGMCWTDTVDSDALWRIYSGPDKDGLVIETTPRKLFQSIDFSFRNNRYADGFIGPVRYEQLNLPDGECFFDVESQRYPRNMVSPFIKRKAFEHEREIRFLIYAPMHWKTINPDSTLTLAEDGKGAYLPLSNLDFIHRIIADPRLNEDKFLTLVKDLRCYNKPIEKSTLYDTPGTIYEILASSGAESMGRLKGAKRWIGNDFIVSNK